MKKLSEYEVAQLGFLNPAPHPVYLELEKLEVNEALFVSRQEW